MTDTELAIAVVLKARERGVITDVQARNALNSINAGTFVPNATPQFVTALTNIAALMTQAQTGMTATIAQVNALKTSSTPI